MGSAKRHDEWSRRLKFNMLLGIGFVGSGAADFRRMQINGGSEEPCQVYYQRSIRALIRVALANESEHKKNKVIHFAA